MSIKETIYLATYVLSVLVAYEYGKKQAYNDAAEKLELIMNITKTLKSNKKIKVTEFNKDKVTIDHNGK